jgi:hypothetical protein
MLPAADGAFSVAMIAPAEVPASAPAAPGFLDGTGAEARFDHPRALALDSDGTLYSADTGNAALRTIAPDANATVSTIPLRSGPAITGTVSGTPAAPAAAAERAMVAEEVVVEARQASCSSSP